MKEHLRAWLADEHGRDQYLIYRNDDVEIHWHGKPTQSDLCIQENGQSRAIFTLNPTQLSQRIGQTFMFRGLQWALTFPLSTGKASASGVDPLGTPPAFPSPTGEID